MLSLFKCRICLNAFQQNVFIIVCEREKRENGMLFTKHSKHSEIQDCVFSQHSRGYTNTHLDGLATKGGPQHFHVTAKVSQPL